MSFVVEVSCRDDRWLLHAPAFGVSRFVNDEESIREGAHTMIAQCGAAPRDFEIELEFCSARDETDARNLPATAPALSTAPADPMARIVHMSRAHPMTSRAQAWTGVRMEHP
ncbi:hypothetical protein [Nocardia sp. NPDC003963]